MKLSVIILNYNVRYFLEQCIRSVQKAIENIDAEIIVIDNSSSDDSFKMMKSVFPEITYIYNKENLGFPKGNNIGVKSAKGEYLCILNPDTVVAEDVFTKLLDFVEDKPNLGIVGCKLIDGVGSFLPESKRGLPTPWVAFTKVAGLGGVFPNNRWFNKYYAQHIDENQIGEVDILVGAFMLLKRDLYLEVGGFDEDCFMYSDDIDLSYTVLKKGKVNYYYPEVSVIHYKGESTLKDDVYRDRFKDAMQFFYKKHFKKSRIFDFVMQLGTVYYSFIKKKSTVNRNVTPDIYYLVSNNDNLIYSIKEKVKGQFKVFSSLDSLKKAINNYINNSINNSKDKYIEIIFDGDFIPNKVIISFMREESSKFITFKIKPSQSNYLIGSDDRNDRGQIILLESYEILKNV